jgi:hypothetical protein
LFPIEQQPWLQQRSETILLPDVNRKTFKVPISKTLIIYCLLYDLFSHVVGGFESKGGRRSRCRGRCLLDPRGSPLDCRGPMQTSSFKWRISEAEMRISLLHSGIVILYHQMKKTRYFTKNGCNLKNCLAVLPTLAVGLFPLTICFQ